MEELSGEEKKPWAPVAEMVRERSKEGKIVSRKELLKELAAQGSKAHRAETAEAELFRRAFEENEDLKELRDQDEEAWLYSSQWMSEAYAKALVRRRGDPLLLMAETIRENSLKYPRPIPLHLFQDLPFEMTEEEIESCLGKMKNLEGYEDIAQTTTSIGTVFLYSKAHLDPDHAAMLAEWLDVGQFNNP